MYMYIYKCMCMFAAIHWSHVQLHVGFLQASLQRAQDDVVASLASARQEIGSLKTTVSQMATDASAIHCQLEAVKVNNYCPYTCTMYTVCTCTCM